MPNIYGITSSNLVDKKKLHKKLVFNVGDKFSAKIKKINNDSKTVLLKTIDGWEFEAELDENLDLQVLQNKLKRFSVTGYDKQNLKVVLLESEKENKGLDTSLDRVIGKLKLEDTKEIRQLLKMMVKFNFPITKENISKMRSFLDFQSKLSSKEYDADRFINSVLRNNNIDINSDKGQKLVLKLKNFMDNFKNLDLKTILTFEENKIAFSAENIKSFKGMNTGEVNIYKGIMELKEELNANNVIDNSKDNNVIGEKHVNNINNESNEAIPNEFKKVDNRILNAISKYNSTSSLDDLLDQFLKNLNIEDNQENKELISSLRQSLEDKTYIEESIKEHINLDGQNNEEVIELKEEILNKDSIIKFSQEEQIKTDIKEKIDSLKDTVKMILENEKVSSSEISSKISAIFEKHFNNFKVFNSLSNQYYYLDAPIEYKEKEYPCKLIIKDDRKKERALDSTNVKLVVSLKTSNIGVVDTYIHINNQQINIDMKCDQLFTKLLEVNKPLLMNRFEDSKYYVSLNVDRREQEVNILNCREFFEDQNIGTLNVRV